MTDVLWNLHPRTCFFKTDICLGYFRTGMTLFWVGGWTILKSLSPIIFKWLYNREDARTKYLHGECFVGESFLLSALRDPCFTTVAFIGNVRNDKLPISRLTHPSHKHCQEAEALTDTTSLLFFFPPQVGNFGAGKMWREHSCLPVPPLHKSYEAAFQRWKHLPEIN